jgi:formamidopyrimidine-DNA glycosylase
VPELPEVEVVRAGLEPAVTGAVVAGVEVLETRSLRRHLAGAADFEARVVGRRLSGAARRGKFLWLPVDPLPGEEPFAVLAHLGMSGQLLLRAPGAEPDRQLRVRIALEHPEHGDLLVAFADQRIFGSLALDPLEATPDGAPGGLGTTAPLVPHHVAHIARDPLDPAFDDDRFLTALLARRTGVKRALLDQTLVSGIGNIYADEALWAARLHYDTPTQALQERDAARLLAELRLVLERALADGGTSFDAQYVNVNGASGYFSQRLNAYGRHGAPCSRCGAAILRASFMNRSSHYCPVCQAA